MKKNVLSLLFLLLTPFPVLAQEIHEYRLENGLKLLVKPDHRFPTVVSQIWYKVGSSYEHGGITGISHALEHMMFRGTKEIPSGKFTEIIQQHGGEQNAFTSFDFTAYYQVLPAEQLAVSFQLESDRMQNLTLDEALFIKEMKAVQEERRLRIDDVPDSLLQERFYAAAYVSSPYRNPTIGWKSDLDSMTVKDLRAWYKRWYSPNNATLVVVGDVDPQKTFELANHYFGKIPSKTITPIKPQKEIKPLGKQKIVVKAPAKLPSIILGYPVPSLVTAKNPKTAYSLLVLSQILSGGESSRLQKELVRQKQIASVTLSQYDLYQRQSGLFLLYGIPAQEHNVKTIQKAFLKQIENLTQYLVDTKELERVKSLIIAQDVYKKDSMQEQAIEIGLLESVGLSFKQGDDHVKQIETITPEDIRKVAKLYLSPERMTIGILKPIPIAEQKNAVSNLNEPSLLEPKNPHENKIPHH